MNQATAPNFNFQPYADAYHRWEEFQHIRRAQLGKVTRVPKPEMFAWTMDLAWVGYLTLERKKPGSSKDVGKNFVLPKRKRVKKLRGQRDRAA
jgi:hypothetical protein